MTVVETDTKSTTNEDASWREVDEGFWAGSRCGSFLGTIERHDARYFARNELMGFVGEYSSLDEAVCAVIRRRR